MQKHYTKDSPCIHGALQCLRKTNIKLFIHKMNYICNKCYKEMKGNTKILETLAIYLGLLLLC